MTPIEIAGYVAAGCMAASKMISLCKTLWDKLPRPIAVALPAIAASLPHVAEAAGLVKTDGGLIMLLMTSAALILPGVAEAESKSSA